MTDQNTSPQAAEEQDLQDMIAEADTGGRAPTGFSARILFGVPLIWSLFQLWYASPLPFIFGVGNMKPPAFRGTHQLCLMMAKLP